jgi:hypothetical protein
LNILKRLTKRIRQSQAIENSSSAFNYTIKELNGIYRANQMLAGQRLGEIIGEEFKKYKRSETLFILGSGPSINKLTRRDFDLIEESDSVGFNFWLVHDFVPTFYCFQHTKINDSVLYKLLEYRREVYVDVPFIVRGSLLTTDVDFCRSMHSRYLDQSAVYLLNEYPVHSTYSGNIPELLEYLRNLGLLHHSILAAFTPKLRGTLGLLLCLAYQMGYNKIVLCGIDMKDSRHFYDASHYDGLRGIFELPKPGASNIMTMEDRKYSPNTVSRYVKETARYMAKHGGVQVYVSDAESALSSILPIWQR